MLGLRITRPTRRRRARGARTTRRCAGRGASVPTRPPTARAAQTAPAASDGRPRDEAWTSTWAPVLPRPGTRRERSLEASAPAGSLRVILGMDFAAGGSPSRCSRIFAEGAAPVGSTRA